jgi:hypothetical protein
MIERPQRQATPIVIAVSLRAVHREPNENGTGAVNFSLTRRSG